MEPSGAGGVNRPSSRKELQGPRPALLKVNKDSYKVKKPPVAPQAHHQPPQEDPPVENRKPVIIYAVSPKVIHTSADNFLELVQRLTGNPATAMSYGDAPAPSPAARIASIEKANLSPKDREVAPNCDDNGVLDNILESAAVEMSRAPGILSPGPATLPPISPGFFSPQPADPFLMGYNMFIPSPSTLFSAPMVLPSPSSWDPLNQFFDF